MWAKKSYYECISQSKKHGFSIRAFASTHAAPLRYLGNMARSLDSLPSQ